jgi:hypothetical protein
MNFHALYSGFSDVSIFHGIWKRFNGTKAVQNQNEVLKNQNNNEIKYCQRTKLRKF